MLSVPCILGKPRGKPKIRRQLVFNKAGVKVGGGGGGVELRSDVQKHGALFASVDLSPVEKYLPGRPVLQ